MNYNTARCVYHIQYEPVDRIAVADRVETHKPGHHVFTHNPACLVIAQPHPFEPDTTVRKFVPWHRVRYVECLEFTPPVT